MKAFAGFVCACSTLQVYAVASSKAYGYTFDPDLLPYQDVPSISPLTARLLLAQRLGLSQYHDLGNPSEDVIKILNDFGATRDQTPFLGDQRKVSERLLIFVENVEHPEGMFFMYLYLSS